jgi:hypothetical protein
MHNARSSIAHSALSLATGLALVHCSLIPGSVRAPFGGSSTSASSGTSPTTATTSSSSSTANTTAATSSPSTTSTATSTTQPPQRYAGELTVVNRTSAPLCDVQVIESNSNANSQHHVAGPVAPGAEVTVRVGRNATKLFASACDGSRSLLGHPTESNLAALTMNRVVIQDAGGADATSATQLALTVAPMESQQWIAHALETELRGAPTGLIEDHALERALIPVINEFARSDRWTEVFESAHLASREYDVTRGRFSGVPEFRRVSAMMGARWPDGHCTMQTFTFQQQHNGARFTGPWSRSSTGGQFTVACVVLRAMQQRTGR